MDSSSAGEQHLPTSALRSYRCDSNTLDIGRPVACAMVRVEECAWAARPLGAWTVEEGGACVVKDVWVYASTQRLAQAALIVTAVDAWPGRRGRWGTGAARASANLRCHSPGSSWWWGQGCARDDLVDCFRALDNASNS